ncbi:hypothetical protein ACLKA7_006775 [Drosophila subpalustris]
MPTMTRMHRHSSSNAAEETRGRRRNVAGGGEANKENFGIHFMSSPFGSSSLIALQDLSNVHGKSPQRRSFSEGSGSGSGSGSGPQMAALRCLPRIGGATTGLEDSQLSSSRMGDTTLDRMLDAIIESARKEVRCKHLTTTTTATATPTATATALPGDGEWSESSIHEMEVRTPTHLKRQRVVRRKNQHQKTTNSHGSTTTTITTTTATTTTANRQRGQLRRQPKQPGLDHIPSIKRCLSFSSSTSSDLEDDDDVAHLAKRSSMASASASASVSSSANTTHSGDFSSRGSIDLSIAYNVQQQKLNVHVIRCRDLQRSHGAGSINAYVKVALATVGGQRQHHPTTQGSTSRSRFQRTAVHRHSSRPYFDERFQFHVAEGMLHATSTSTTSIEEQQLQLAVWHRDRHLNTLWLIVHFLHSKQTQQPSPGQGVEGAWRCFQIRVTSRDTSSGCALRSKSKARL